MNDVGFFIFYEVMYDVTELLVYINWQQVNWLPQLLVGIKIRLVFVIDNNDNKAFA